VNTRMKNNAYNGDNSPNQGAIEMDEDTNLWNTKMSDLTVGDNVKMTFMTPIIMVGGMIAAGALVGGIGAGMKRFQSWQLSRQVNKTVSA